MDRGFSREEYRRRRETQAKGRYDRVGGRIVALVRECAADLRMKAAVFLALHGAIGTAGTPSQVLPAGAAVGVGDSDNEPDAPIIVGGLVATAAALRASLT